MPIYLRKQVDAHGLLAVWHLTEGVETLFEICTQRQLIDRPEIVRANRFTNNKRKREWLGTRLLLSEMTDSQHTIYYAESGRPFFKDQSYNISISHSGDLVAVLLSRKHQVGIDVEQVSDKIARIALKFLHPQEVDAIKSMDDITKLYLHWCAKEVLYKIADKTGLSFKNNMKINSVDKIALEGTFMGNIFTNQFKEHFLLNYMLLPAQDNKSFNDKYMLVWSLK